MAGSLVVPGIDVLHAGGTGGTGVDLKAVNGLHHRGQLFKTIVPGIEVGLTAGKQVPQLSHKCPALLVGHILNGGGNERHHLIGHLLSDLGGGSGLGLLLPVSCLLGPGGPPHR